MENWEDMQGEQPEKCGYWKKKRGTSSSPYLLLPQYHLLGGYDI